MLGIACRRFSQQQQLQHLHNLHFHTNLATLNQFLLSHKPTYSFVYFRASWNPLCKKTDVQIKEIAEKNKSWTISSVDMDVPEAQAISFHYKIRAEPEYILCLYGDEVGRQVGRSSEKLQQKLDRTVQISSQIPSTTEELWRPYGSTALKYHKDRLAMLHQRHF